MGVDSSGKVFSYEDIKNRELILKMLEYEDKLYLSDKGQEILKNYGDNFVSLEGSKIIQRMTLQSFGFSSSDDSMKNYRRIFHNYYNSSEDYDKEVLSKVFYMRENRCLYYKEPEINIGDTLPDIDVYNLDGKTQTSIHNILNNKDYNHCIIAAFSMS